MIDVWMIVTKRPINKWLRHLMLFIYWLLCAVFVVYLIEVIGINP